MNAVFWDVTPRGSCKDPEPHGVTSQMTAFFTGGRDGRTFRRPNRLTTAASRSRLQRALQYIPCCISVFWKRRLKTVKCMRQVPISAFPTEISRPSTSSKQTSAAFLLLNHVTLPRSAGEEWHCPCVIVCTRRVGTIPMSANMAVTFPRHSNY
jgi:hypothetical protein